jgi:hypothetical protein
VQVVYFLEQKKIKYVYTYGGTQFLVAPTLFEL